VHEISIPDGVIQRIVAQRGRLYRYEDLVGPRTALVVIDLQNVFMLPGMPIEVPTAHGIVPQVNRLAGAVREAGGHVVWVKMTLSGQQDSWSVFFDGDPRSDVIEHLTEGAHGHELHAELDVAPTDIILQKVRYSAFIQGSSPIDDVLRAAGVDTVIIAGALTNVCCESSARDAMMLNYRVIFVSDANATLSDEQHNATLATIFQVFGDVRSTDSVIELLSASRANADAARSAAG
jgi:ureidoacrylate peracid hydrolase